MELRQLAPYLLRSSLVGEAARAASAALVVLGKVLAQNFLEAEQHPRVH
jgi:hypothetical protein